MDGTIVIQSVYDVGSGFTFHYAHHLYNGVSRMRAFHEEGEHYPTEIKGVFGVKVVPLTLVRVSYKTAEWKAELASSTLLTSKILCIDMSGYPRMEQ